MTPFRQALIRAICSAVLAGATSAQSDPAAADDPDWLAERGLEFRAIYTTDVLANVAGGRDRGVDALGNLDLQLSAELEPLVGWRGARAFVYALGNHGGPFTDRVGDAQVVSSIEAPEAVRLFEAWLEQDLGTAPVSLRVGLYDVNSEFDHLPTAGVFVNSSYGTSAVFGNSGRNGPSIFPASSLAARANWRWSDAGYLRVVVADGVSQDPRDPGATTIRFGDDDGLLWVAEFGHLVSDVPEILGRTRIRLEELPAAERPSGAYRKLALGVHGYTDGLGPDRDASAFGVYALAEQSLYVEPDALRQGLAAFGRLGWGQDALGPFDAFAATGLVYRGLFRTRPDDRIGIAVAAARFGDAFRRASGPDWERWEANVELTWRFPLTPWLTVQPDLQYVVQPGGDPARGDAWVVGLRGILRF